MKENRRVIFNSDPNKKLNNRVFCFIRKHDPERFIKGKFLDVFTKLYEQEQLFVFKALIIHVETHSIGDMPEHYIYLDTGYSKNKTIEIMQKSYSKYSDPATGFMDLKFDLVVVSRYYERKTEDGHDLNPKVVVPENTPLDGWPGHDPKIEQSESTDNTANLSTGNPRGKDDFPF